MNPVPTVLDISDRFIAEGLQLRYYVEASDIGLTAGVWPDFIRLLRDGQPTVTFARTKWFTQNGELKAMIYTAGSLELHVIND